MKVGDTVCVQVYSGQIFIGRATVEDPLKEQFITIEDPLFYYASQTNVPGKIKEELQHLIGKPKSFTMKEKDVMTVYTMTDTELLTLYIKVISDIVVVANGAFDTKKKMN